MSIPSYESPNGDDIEAPCKWCGADYSDHDYEQQARYCWPVRAEHWERLAFSLAPKQPSHIHKWSKWKPLPPDGDHGYQCETCDEIDWGK